MACENAINATDALAGHIRSAVPEAEWPAVAAKAVFANTAVDRIVPAQAPDAGLDVTVETYFEWAIERPPFGGQEPSIPDATWVDDLAPYIERKLFTVNTGHATTAYHGFVRGIKKLSDALADDVVRAAVTGVLGETKQLLVAKHEFSRRGPAGLRGQDPAAVRQPVPAGHRRPGRPAAAAQAVAQRAAHRAGRRAGRAGRPARAPAGHGGGGALSFDVPDDPESVELQQLLRTLTAAEATERITGLTPADPLYADVVAVLARRIGGALTRATWGRRAHGWPC